MLPKRSGIQRRLIMLATAGGSIADLARGLSRSDSGKRWLVPLAVFLCAWPDARARWNLADALARRLTETAPLQLGLGDALMS